MIKHQVHISEHSSWGKVGHSNSKILKAAEKTIARFLQTQKIVGAVIKEKNSGYFGVGMDYRIEVSCVVKNSKRKRDRKK